MSDWCRLCAEDATLAEKRAALEAHHFAAAWGSLQENLAAAGHEIPAEWLAESRATVLESLQPYVDENFALLFGAAQMN